MERAERGCSGGGLTHGNILAQYLVNKLNCATPERATLKVSVVSIDFLLLSDLEKNTSNYQT